MTRKSTAWARLLGWTALYGATYWGALLGFIASAKYGLGSVGAVFALGCLGLAGLAFGVGMRLGAAFWPLGVAVAVVLPGLVFFVGVRTVSSTLFGPALAEALSWTTLPSFVFAGILAGVGYLGVQCARRRSNH